MNFEIKILGSNSAIPTAKKFPSSQLVTVNHKYYLIDCGEGAQMQLRKFGLKFQRIEAIFISHLHGDHFFGLVGLLMTMQLLDRKRGLKVFAHKGLKEIVDLQLKVTGGKLNFPIHFIELKRNQEGIVFDDGNVEVLTFPLNHGISCSGFLIKEKEKLRKLIKNELDRLNISISDYKKLQQGEDVISLTGQLVKNKEVTLDPSRQRTYAYCSDTAYSDGIIAYIKGIDLLYHEATFADDMQDRARKTKHSTGRQAATIAFKAGVKKLIIGHFSVRYDNPNIILEEAKEIFKNTEVAQESDTFVLNY